MHQDDSIASMAQIKPNSTQKEIESGQKLKQLEELGVIENVSGQTSWMNPFVVLEKPNSDMRICLDMRQANLVILWEVHTRDIRDKLKFSANLT